MELNPTLPMLQDICPVCDVYGPQDNGSIKVPAPMNVSGLLDPATVGDPGPGPGYVVKIVDVQRCHHCGWASRAG